MKTYFDSGALIEGVDYTEPVQIHTSEKVEFRGCSFKMNELPILCNDEGGVHLEVRNCTFEGDYHPSDGSQNKSIDVYGYHAPGSTVIIENNTGIGYRGFWIKAFGEGSKVRISGNKWKNIEGRPNGEKEPDKNDENSQFCMIIEMENVDIEVSYNYIHQYAHKSKVEDVINIGEAFCSEDNPARVHSNLVWGAFDYDITEGLNGGGYAGSGIQIEGLEPKQSRNVLVYNNTLIDCCNHALAVSGLVGGEVYGNRIVSDGYTEDGTYIEHKTWRGIVVGNPFWQEEATQDVHVHDNFCQYPQNTGGGSQLWNNQMEIGPNVTEANNTTIESPDGAKARKEQFYAEWFDMIAEKGITIGAEGTTPPIDPDPDPDPKPDPEPDGDITKKDLREFRQEVKAFRDELRTTLQEANDLLKVITGKIKQM